MKILLCGANGFVGRHIKDSLEVAGHTVISGVRRSRNKDEIAIDYLQDFTVESWLPRLENIDAVINAVGVLRDTNQTPMHLLHSTAPRALFAAAEQLRLKKVIQISALGVQGDLATKYTQSKAEADIALQKSQCNWTIFRPSLVYGEDGASAKMFRLLARLPIVSLPGKGDMQVQPVHIDDVGAAVVASLTSPLANRAIIDCVGSRALSYKAMLQSYAQQLGTKHQLFVPIPWFVMQMSAYLAHVIPSSPLEPETLAMLKAGSVADTKKFSDLLGYEPSGVDHFINRVKS